MKAFPLPITLSPVSPVAADYTRLHALFALSVILLCAIETLINF